MNTITQLELKSRLHYNPKTGVFTRISSSSAGPKIGDIAGWLQDGYRKIMVNGKTYFAHRLAWLYVYGEFPENQIDHINHIRNDNRISNLRDASGSDNQRNQRVAKNNTSGTIGVIFNNLINRWVARIGTPQKRIFLGRFKKKEDAIKARKEAEIYYGYHRNHGL